MLTSRSVSINLQALHGSSPFRPEQHMVERFLSRRFLSTRLVAKTQILHSLAARGWGIPALCLGALGDEGGLHRVAAIAGPVVWWLVPSVAEGRKGPKDRREDVGNQGAKLLVALLLLVAMHLLLVALVTVYIRCPPTIGFNDWMVLSPQLPKQPTTRLQTLA